MLIAISELNNRIAPVFDVSCKIRIFEKANNSHIEKESISIDPNASELDRLQLMQTNGISLLICGAISRPLLNLLQNSGLIVIPFVAGEVNNVLNALKENQLDSPAFSMPGCAMSSCRRRRRRDGSGRGRGIPKNGRGKGRNRF